MLAAPSSCVTFNPPQPGRNKFGSAKITPVRDLPHSKYYQYCGAGPILAAPPAVTNANIVNNFGLLKHVKYT